MILEADTGQRLVVVSAAAPLWTDATEALATVAVCGEPTRVLGEAGPLVTVELPAQPNGDAGYVGLMDPRHVGVDERAAVTHVVGPGVVDVPAGASVEKVRSVNDGLVEVRLPNGTLRICSDRDLRPAPRSWPTAGGDADADDVVATAQRFVGSPYVWGGLEATGIDCSGLVHLAARIAGRVVPRDAHHQWAALRVEQAWDDLRHGDLLFFGEHAALDGIDHVGFYVGNGQILHAPETGRAVVVESISVRGRDRVVAFGRF